MACRIIEETNLGPDDVLVDLGAGVGNVLIQAALQTGCETYGVEIQKSAAEVGVEQVRPLFIPRYGDCTGADACVHSSHKRALAQQRGASN